MREAKTAYKVQFDKVKHDPKEASKTVNKILSQKQNRPEINSVKTQNGDMIQLS